MKPLSLAIALMFTIGLIAEAHGAAAAASTAGTGDSVKKWADKNFDQATAAHKPVLLYIYDHDAKRNPTAAAMEGPKFLGDADVKAKERDFLCLKDKMSEGNNFPHDWVQLADGGAAVIVLSSDMKVIKTFGKKDALNSTDLVAAMTAALAATGNSKPSIPNKNDNKVSKAPAGNGNKGPG
jgi:hypothetical protein